MGGESVLWGDEYPAAAKNYLEYSIDKVKRKAGYFNDKYILTVSDVFSKMYFACSEGKSFIGNG